MSDFNFTSYPQGLPADTVKLHNGVTLHFRSSDAGQIPVVFVHDYPLSSAIWEKVQILLSTRYRSYAPDLRGFGQSDKPGHGYGYEDLAADLDLFMKGIKVRQAVFVGHGFGATIVQHLAVRYPNRVLAMVLAGARASFLPPGDEMVRLQDAMAGSGTAGTSLLRGVREIATYSFDRANINPEDLDFFANVGQGAGPAALDGALQTYCSTPAMTREELAAGVKVPTMFVVGTHDLIAPFEHTVTLSDTIHRSRIVVMARCGHSPMWEKPIEFVKAIAEFLGDNGLR